MICLVDSDLIKKLAVCDLLDAAFEAISAPLGEIFVLPTARYVLLKPVKKPEQAKARLGEPVFDRLIAFFANVQTLVAQPSAEEQRLFDDIIGIDSGEAILFSSSAQFGEFRLATGDKNSLRALASHPECRTVCERLDGKVVCFEQIILAIIKRLGFDTARAKIAPGANCDTALRAAFGSGLDATEDNVLAVLASYIADLRKQTGFLLVQQLD